MYFVDTERRILYWNEGAYRLTGYKAEELLGKCCQDNFLCHVDHSGISLCQQGCPLTACITDGGLHEANVFLRHKQGHRVPVTVRVQPVRRADGSLIGSIEIFSDDSRQIEVRRKADAMERLAFLDHLTQLPNRRFMEMALQTALSENQVHKDPFGLLLIDLNGFKAINDSFGHSCGDSALLEAASTLTGALRPMDIVGRWGGDEFVAIARNVDLEILSELADRCVALIAQTAIPVNEETRIPLSISVGTVLSHSSETAEGLIHMADMVMYRSKTSGRLVTTTEQTEDSSWIINSSSHTPNEFEHMSGAYITKQSSSLDGSN